MKHIFTLAGIFILILSIPASNATAEPHVPVSKASCLKVTGPLGFIENKGQFLDQNQNPRTDLLYMFLRKGMKVQLMANHMSMELYTLQDDKSTFDEATGFPDYSQLDPEDRPDPRLRYESSRIDLEFIGANPDPEIIAEGLMPDYLNYYLAYTPVEGITRVKQYNKITYKNLYNHIDLVLIATPDQNPENSLAYDFVVHPGGNVKDIKYYYHGSDDQALLENGTLETGTRQGKITEMIPESYLKNNDGLKLMPVNVSFDLNNNVIGFQVNTYDKNQSLVIDPLLVWATYCGGDSSEEGRGLTTDSLGNVALIGRSNSTNNIATVGAYQTTCAGNVDINVDKYDSAGVRIWGTYYGGTGDDKGRGLVADKFNNYYLGCHTNSTTGCATPGAYRENFAGGVSDDGLLAYFSADGFRIFGTYYGGTKEETIRRLAIDNDGNVLMIGYSFSDTGIATPGVYQTQYGGGADLCLSKWTPDGQLIWGSYLGGPGEEHGRSVTIDKDDNIYINGSCSSEGLATPGVSRTTHADKQDFLLGKFTTNGQIAWVSYWGGAVEDRGRGVFVDSSSKYVYFTGYSASDTGVATPGAYQEHWVEGYDNQGEPYHDMVIMKWTLDGQVIWSTYLGGAKDDRGRAITMIGDNEIYISGSTESNDVIATPDGFDPVWGGKGDMFLETFDSSGFRSYGTYFGGTGDEDNLALAVDDVHQNIYLIGTGNTLNLGTPGTEQPVRSGMDDALLVKIQVHAPTYPPTPAFTYSNVPCSNGVVQFTNLSSNADQFFWDFGDGTNSIEISPAHTYTSTGDFTVTLTATNSATGASDSTSSLISVMNIIATATITPAGPTTFCDGQSVVLNANTGIGYTYKWKNGAIFISGATNSSYTATESGDYHVVVTVSLGCSATSIKATVVVNPTPSATILEGGSVAACEGNTVVLNANNDPGATYQWLSEGIVIPGATSGSITISSGGNYSVMETNSFSCSDTSATTVVTINANPPATISANGSPSICEGNSVDLDANSGNGLQYQWQLNGSDISGATNISYNASQEGSYSVIVTSPEGCSASSGTITVTVNPNPTVTAFATDASICLNDAVTLSGTGAETYVWQPGNISGQSIEVSPQVQTTYSVTGTDANGCKDDDDITITVLPLPSVFLGADTTLCDTLNFILDAGSGFSSYLWSTGASTQTINVTSTDNFWVVVKDANECSGSDTIHVEFVICDGVSSIANAYNVYLYPNPTTGNFVLSFSNPHAENVTVQLENMIGQEVMSIYKGQTAPQFNKEINAAALPAAVYHVKILIGDQMITKKLVIE